MSWRRSWAMARHELRMLKDDPGAIVFLFVMPLLMMGLMKPLFALSLQAEGYAGASGAEQAVPGMAAMFATFTASFAGFGFFREHGWGTWDRLRASAATTGDIMAGKLAPTLIIAVGQIVVLFGAGMLFLDLRIAGSFVALTLIIVTFSMSMVAFGMAIMSLSRTSLQLNTWANLVGILFAGVGGALVPIAVLPGWVQTIAPAVPTYWAMKSFHGVILDGRGVASVLVPIAILLGFGVLFSVIAGFKFRFEETKIYYG